MAPATRTRQLSRPLGVTLLALWEVISGIQLLLMGLVLWGASSDAERGAVSSMLFLLGLVFLLMAVSYFFWARGYLRGYERARRRGRSCAVLVIILAIGAIILLGSAVRLLMDSPFWTIISNLAIVLYLGRPGVKAFFSSRS